MRLWFRKRPSAEDMRQELEAHLALRADHDGSDEVTARRRMGNVLQTQEAMRRVWIAALLDTLIQDARFTWRSWRHHPGFAVSAVMVLALGLGASTAMFSALDRILFRPAPYANPEQLMQVGMTLPKLFGREQISLLDRNYDRWSTPPDPFVAVTTGGGGYPCDVTEEQPERLLCALVEANFLRTFGIRPELGRDLTAEDDVRGAPRVALISHALWTRRFGADPKVVGRTMNIDGQPVPVIGVLPADFELPRGNADVLFAHRMFPIPAERGNAFGLMTAFGRLKPGATPEQAEAAIAPLIAEDAKGMRRTSKDDYRPRVRPLRDYQVGNATRAAWLLLGAVAGLLLIACVNVTNLILARLAAREREFAVRSALGAGKLRLARLALTESLLLAVTGGGLGLGIAYGLLKLFVNLAPSSIPKIGEASLDLRVFAVAAALAALAGLAIGMWPAISVLRSRSLQHGVRATSARPRLRFTLVTAQIALTVAMLGGSALLLHSLWNLVRIPLGFESGHVITMDVTLNVARYPLDRRADFFADLLGRVRQTPGTIVATLSNAPIPLGLLMTTTNPPVDGHPRDPNAAGPSIRIREVTPGYFETVRIPFVRGRTVPADEFDPSQPPAFLSESAARSLFPGQDPLGHTVQVSSQDPWYVVAGVVRDIQNTPLKQEPQPELYAMRERFNSAVTGLRAGYFAIRTTASPTDAAALMKQAVADVDPQLPVEIKTLNDQVEQLTEQPRFVAWLLSAFAGLALLLAAMGLYGVASYLVTQRTRDIGVRMALGAAPRDIAGQLVGEAGRWILAGALCGGALAWVAVRALQSELYEVTAGDPWSWGAALGALGAALVVAIVRPAARAARVDPMVALREE